MTQARKHLVCLSDTPYYHITSRCVRRAFLCGKDAETGKNFEHRRHWIEDRIRVLSSLFSIDLCAYAVMSNHYHLVVKIRPCEAITWSDDEVLDRWTALFRGPLIVQRYQARESLTEVELETLQSMTAVFKSRLQSLSWFMKCLNEPIARMANSEDGCTGHFWEARFHSKPLRSEQALIVAMAYVDLNPIRANLAITPEHSNHTSIKARIEGNHKRGRPINAVSRMLERGELFHFNGTVKSLMGFSKLSQSPPHDDPTSAELPICETEYLNLVDVTGRIVAHDKRGRINPALDPILLRLNLSATQWIQASTQFDRCFRGGFLRLNTAA